MMYQTSLLLRLVPLIASLSMCCVDAAKTTVLRGSQSEKILLDVSLHRELPEATVTKKKADFKNKNTESPSSFPTLSPTIFDKRNNKNREKEKEKDLQSDVIDDETEMLVPDDKNRDEVEMEDAEDPTSTENLENTFIPVPPRWFPTDSPVQPPAPTATGTTVTLPDREWAPIERTPAPVPDPTRGPIWILTPSTSLGSSTSPPTLEPTLQPVPEATLPPTMQPVLIAPVPPPMQPIPVATMPPTMKPIPDATLPPTATPELLPNPIPTTNPIFFPVPSPKPTETTTLSQPSPSMSFGGSVVDIANPALSKPPTTKPTFPTSSNPPTALPTLSPTLIPPTEEFSETAGMNSIESPNFGLDGTQFIARETLQPIIVGMKVQSFTDVPNPEELETYFKVFIEDISSMRTQINWYPFYSKSALNVTVDVFYNSSAAGDVDGGDVKFIVNGMVGVHAKRNDLSTTSSSERTAGEAQQKAESSFVEYFDSNLLLYLTFWGTDELKEDLEEITGLQNLIITSVSLGETELISFGIDASDNQKYKGNNDPSNRRPGKGAAGVSGRLESSASVSNFGLFALAMMLMGTLLQF